MWTWHNWTKLTFTNHLNTYQVRYFCWLYQLYKIVSFSFSVPVISRIGFLCRRSQFDLYSGFIWWTFACMYKFKMTDIIKTIESCVSLCCQIFYTFKSTCLCSAYSSECSWRERTCIFHFTNFDVNREGFLAEMEQGTGLFHKETKIILKEWKNKRFFSLVACYLSKHRNYIF